MRYLPNHKTMDETKANLTIPVDATSTVAAEHSSLRDEVINTRSQCHQLQNQLKNIIVAAMNSRSKAEDRQSNGADSESICSSLTSVNTVKSIDSVGTIRSCVDSSSDGKTGMSGNSIVPDIEKFIDLTREGKLDITDELMGELYSTNVRVDAVSEVADGLQIKWSEIDTALKTIKSDIEAIRQYIKIENLLLHNFRIPPKGYTSLQYSEYVANELNKYLPHLPIKVKWDHISTAHTLPTKAKKSNVIIVRFCNRNVKEAIFNAKHLLPKHLSITEHLNVTNLSVFKKAQYLFGYDFVHTMNCKVFVDLYGKSYKVSTIEDVHKLFVDYCEFIGSDQSELSHPPASTISYVSACSRKPTTNNYHYASALKYGRPSYAPKPNTSTNLNLVNSVSNFERRQSQHGRNRYYRGKKPSTGYSVRNRVY